MNVVRSRSRFGKRLLSWTLLLTFATLLLAAGAYRLSYSGLFDAKVIRINGESHLSQDQITELAGLVLGVNVFHFDTKTAVERLTSEEWIKSAEVRKELPSTIVVDVVERRPIAVINAADVRYLVSPDGTDLGPADADAASGGLTEVVVALGTSPTREQAAGAARVVATMPAQLTVDVTEIELGEDGQITVHLESGVTASYGDGSQARRKSQAVLQVLRWATQTGTGLTSIDVSAPSAPTATPRYGGVLQPLAD